ncbi:zinc knuckle [Ostertagia ostertagi]
MDDLHKMNYLMDALQGEARECVKQYEVSRHTYPVVIAYLQEKYGDHQALVDELLKRLQNTRASSDSLKDQGNLCERLTSLKQLLRKFSIDVQRHILRQQQHHPLHTKWDTNDLLIAAKDYIRDESKILHSTETPIFERHTVNDAAKPSQAERGRRNMKDKIRAECFYCNKGGHSPKQCKEVPSREQRIEVLKRKNLCWNCGEQGHLSPQCARGNCRLCDEFGHHTSICKKAALASTKTPTATVSSSSKVAPVSKKSSSKTGLIRKTTAKMHSVTSESNNQDECGSNVVLHVSNNLERSEMPILVGQAQVLNPETQTLESVQVVLDSGADRSFISDNLADRLHLPELDRTVLKICTFGSKTPITKTCGISKVQIWDRQGVPHSYSVTRIEVLTEPIQRSMLTPDDKKFLFENDIALSIRPNTTNIKPDILLGCSDLFTLLEDEIGQQQTLPSGLRVIPSKLGHLVIGRTGVLNDESPTNAVTVSDESTLPQVSTARDKEEYVPVSLQDHQMITALEQELSHEDFSCSDASLVNSSSEDSTSMWEQFFAFETSGVSEFLGPTEHELVKFFPMPDKIEESNSKNCVVNLSTSAIASVSDLLDWKRHSSWQSCQTTMAYALRFIKAIVSRVDADLRSRIANHAPDIMKMSGEPYVTAAERKIAQRILLRNHQQVHLPESRQQVLKQLKLQRDNDGIIRTPESAKKEESTPVDSRHISHDRGQEADTLAGSKQNPRYNLRSAAKGRRSYQQPISTSNLILTLTLALALAGTVNAEFNSTITNVAEIRCVPGGVRLNSDGIRRYELCSEQDCFVNEHPTPHEEIMFAPEVTLHEHQVQWKVYDGSKVTVLNAICPAANFCENIRCWICTANIFNPECSPRSAIAAIAVFIYLTTAVLYVFCYVPIVVGKPFRILSWGTLKCMAHTVRLARTIWRGCVRIAFRRRLFHRRQQDVEAFLRAPLITLTILAIMASAVYPCQEVDIFSQPSTICHVSPQGQKTCLTEATEILKMNSFHQEACLRLLYNQTLVRDVRIRWKGLRLTCAKETLVFTRDSEQRVMDSKRCETMGSCKERAMRITLTTLTVPPTPLLSSTFISDSTNFALWKMNNKPTLQCESHEAAQSLNCSVLPDCDCQPAENKVNCLCKSLDIADHFENRLENRFPIRRPWITLTHTVSHPKTVEATIPMFTTAEVLIHFKDKYDTTVTDATDAICSVKNSIAKGCYKCPQGAVAPISCTTNGASTLATVRCEDEIFTVPCKQEGAPSVLQFNHDSARIHKKCVISCGSIQNTFEITGILQWVRTIHSSALKVLAGESNVYDEIVFPDINHILDVVWQWYKTLALAGGLLLLAIIFGYLCFWSCGVKIVLALICACTRAIRFIAHIFIQGDNMEHGLPEETVTSLFCWKSQIQIQIEASPYNHLDDNLDSAWDNTQCSVYKRDRKQLFSV